LSNPQNGKFHIPIPLIVVAYIFSFPVGILLTILAYLGSTGKLGENKQGSAEADRESSAKSAQTQKVKTASVKKEKKKRSKSLSAASVTFTVLAVVFLLCAVVTLIEGISMSGITSNLVTDTATLGVFSIASYIAATIFQKKKSLQNSILSILGKRETMDLDKLASMAGVPLKKLKKELQKLIDKEEFGDEAFLDLGNNRFMRHPNPEMEKAPGREQKQEEDEYCLESDNFRAIILQIRKLNDDIKDYAVSERIYRIEEHTQNIFDYVTEHPEAMNQIRTFMNYYLPTTLKLLSSYSRIEQMGVAGENMKESKEKIESILDLLVTGFEQQVDQLFKHESMDISSEIKVLETMMRQDGLDGRNDFSPGYSDDFGGGSTQAMPKNF